MQFSSPRQNNSIKLVIHFALPGTITPASLREKLETARRSNDREAIEKAIDDCLSSGHPELIPEINQIRKHLDGQGYGQSDVQGDDRGGQLSTFSSYMRTRIMLPSDLSPRIKLKMKILSLAKIFQNQIQIL